MSVRLYNTLTRRVEELSPNEPGHVRVYCCGPTVYDVPHAGHARAALGADLLIRRLRAQGVRVTYVRNITDVDDKILERAKARGEPPLDLSRRMAVIYQDQMRTVGCLPPDHEPRVSEHLPQIVDLIERLIAHDAAYVADRAGGAKDVYFSVRSFAGYGKLSGRRLEDLKSGARVEPGEHKRDPLDFALWKGATAEEWGWDSPWGRGRPGWHIECSAMSTHLLGHGFDVHAGGMDLIFPHHENEIAQSEAAAPDEGPFARLWMHNGFVNVDKEKMSKSLGNFVTVQDVLDRNDPEAFRWFLLSAQYRGPIQFDTETLADGRVVFPGVDEAERRVDYVFGVWRRLEEVLAVGLTAPSQMPAELRPILLAAESAEEQAGQALDDDLNSPVALAAVGELARLGNELSDLAHKRRKDPAVSGGAALVARRIRDSLLRVADQLGLLQVSFDTYEERTRARRLKARNLTAALIEERVQARADARKSKDFALSDRIRDELTTLGVALHDGPDGTQWSIAP